MLSGMDDRWILGLPRIENMFVHLTLLAFPSRRPIHLDFLQDGQARLVQLLHLHLIGSKRLPKKFSSLLIASLRDREAQPEQSLSSCLEGHIRSRHLVLAGPDFSNSTVGRTQSFPIYFDSTCFTDATEYRPMATHVRMFGRGAERDL